MSPRARSAGAAGLLAAALAVSACAADDRLDAVPSTAAPGPSLTSGPSPSTPEGLWRVSGEPSTLASGLRSPWSVAPLPDGGALISERDSGVVRELTAAGALREAGLVPGVVAGGESGLHGLALLDDDGTRWLYAYHGAAEDNRVVRMPFTGASGSLALGEAQSVFSGIPRANVHDGGRIAFGPDGYLYVATGDAGARDAAQDPDALGGKILRLTPEGDAAPDNPLDSAVWSLGHRNVQGLAWTSDGAMWASEFGQNTWDELNRIEPGGNYGWPVVEGEGGDGRFVDPTAVWPTVEASPSGIAAIGETVFMAGLRGERLWAIDTTSGAPVVALTGQGRLRDAVAAPDGTLWVLTNNTDGRGSPREGDDLLLRVPVARAE
ncbi:MAG: PQQ-dependent sugar dehydrogenase [Microbacterium sp.]